MKTNKMVTYVEELETLKELPIIERFTTEDGCKKAMTSAAEGWKRLAEYEATGVSPRVVRLLKKMWFGKE